MNYNRAIVVIFNSNFDSLLLPRAYCYSRP